MGVLRRELAGLDSVARAAQDNEQRARNAEHPPTLACLTAARQEPLLWSRRPGAARFLDVRVGVAALPSRLSFDLPSDRRAMPAARTALTELTRRYADIANVPVALSLTGHGCVGIAGEPREALGFARAVACQVTSLHSPAEVVLTAFCGTSTAADWDWLKWLPHTSSPHSPLTGPHLVGRPRLPGAAVATGRARARPPRQPGRGGTRHPGRYCADRQRSHRRPRPAGRAQQDRSVGRYLLRVGSSPCGAASGCLHGVRRNPGPVRPGQGRPGRDHHHRNRAGRCRSRRCRRVQQAAVAPD